MIYQNTADFLVTLMTLLPSCDFHFFSFNFLLRLHPQLLPILTATPNRFPTSSRGDHFLDLEGRRPTPDWAVMISRTCTHTYIEYIRVSPAPLRRFGRAPGATSRKPEPQRDMRNRHHSYITCRWSTPRHARCVMSSCLVRQ